MIFYLFILFLMLKKICFYILLITTFLPFSNIFSTDINTENNINNKKINVDDTNNKLGQKKKKIKTKKEVEKKSNNIDNKKINKTWDPNFNTINNKEDQHNTNNKTTDVPATKDNNKEKTISTTKNNILIEILNKRKEDLKKILNKTESEREVDKEKNKQELIKIQKGIIENLNKTLSNEITNIKDTIINNKKVLDELSKEKLLTSRQKKQIKGLQNQNIKYQNKIDLLKKTIETNNNQLEKYKILGENQGILLQKAIELKKELEQKNNIENMTKIKKSFLFLSLLLLLYLLILLIDFLYFKNKINKRYIHYDIIITLKSLVSILLIIYIIGSLFYVFPKYIFILFFAFSAILVISAPIVWSYISSILLLWKINIGDRLIIKKESIDGIITNIWLIFLTLNEIKDNRLTDNIIRISTRQLLLQPYKINKKTLEYWNFKKNNIKKKDIFIENENKEEVREIEFIVDLDWKELNLLLLELKKRLSKKLSNGINEKNLYTIDYSIKEDKINIKILIKADKKTENKLKLQIYNLIKNIKNKEKKED